MFIDTNGKYCGWIDSLKVYSICSFYKEFRFGI